MSRSAQVLVAWLVLSLLVAGCGTERVGKEEYGRQLREVSRDLAAEYPGVAGPGTDRLADDPGDGSAVEQEGRLEDTRVALEDAAARLAGIQPPEELEDAHRDLVAGVRDIAASVEALLEAQRVATSDPVRARRLTREFAAGTGPRRVVAAAARLQDAGVDPGL